ncbi:MAG: thioether cross-link-forming SCIFF peptide maturase [Bacillota bacterium]|nr:thioether cross-link-forming SCIFF peptide maturase [Bacillota bacterium]
MSDIHKFLVDGQEFVIDVNTGTVHQIDELVYDLLDEEGLKSLEELKKSYQGKYSQNEIEEAYLEIKELIEEGLLYTKDVYKDIAGAYEKGEDYIKALCLNIAHDCNLRCKYCFADEGEYRGKRELMSFEVGKRAIDFVIKHSGPRKNIEVDLFGGEPLMVFDTVKKIVDYGKGAGEKSGKNIRFTMTTNCTLLNDEIMDYLNKNMVNIVLSLDGRKEVNDKVRVRADGTGSFDAIVPKIKKMIEKRDKDKAYYVRGTFTRENLDFSEDLKFLAEEGFKEISIEPVVLPDENPLSIREQDLPKIMGEYDKVYKFLSDRKKNSNKINFYHFNINLNGGPCVYKRISGCGAGHEYVAVTPSGDIYPCHQFVGNLDFKMGNIFENEMRTDIGLTLKKAHIYNKPKCRECWARFYCSGGCQANNYNFNKDFNTPYAIGCEMQKKRIECAIALNSIDG